MENYKNTYMSKQDVQLSLLLRFLGGVCGGVRFQCIVFILQSRGVDFGRIHYKYGSGRPHSEDLILILESLMGRKIVIMTTDQPRCFYAINRDNDYAQHFPEEYDPEMVNNRRFLWLLNGMPVYNLKILASIFFLKEMTHRDYSDDSITRRRLLYLNSGWTEADVNEMISLYHEFSRETASH